MPQFPFEQFLAALGITSYFVFTVAILPWNGMSSNIHWLWLGLAVAMQLVYQWLLTGYMGD